MIDCISTGGYHANFQLRLSEFDAHCYIDGDTFCKVKGSMWESALDDGFGNCNQCK